MTSSSPRPGGRPVAVVGCGNTAFGRHPEATLDGLGLEASRAAIADAGIAVGDIDVAFVGNAAAGLVTGQEQIRGQVALRDLGLDHVPVFNTENACASSSSALHLAWAHVASGLADTALVLGVEKLSHPDKTVTFNAIGTASDPRTLREVLGLAEDEPLPTGRSIFMDLYAERVVTYMEQTGATAEDFASVVVKSRANAARNPFAQLRTEVTVEEVLSSPEVVGPLRRLMCSPTSDGASAVVITAEDRVTADQVPVWIAASVVTSGLTSGPAASPHGATRVAATKAYERAGIGPEDVDVIELHDATAPSELMHMENIGLCLEGEAVGLVRDGTTLLSGRQPVNPSGGLLSRGHPLGATGVAQIVELGLQLTGRAGARQVAGEPRVALAQNGGGNIGGQSAAVVVTILER